MLYVSCKHLKAQTEAYMNVVSQKSVLHASGMFSAYLKCLHGVRRDLACCVHVAGRDCFACQHEAPEGNKIINYLLFE